MQLQSSASTVQLHATGVTALEPGQTLAVRYYIQSVLGVGGMGMVYKATDKELGEIVAVKTLKPDMLEQDPTALERFKNEIRLARKISTATSSARMTSARWEVCTSSRWNSWRAGRSRI